MIFAKDDKNTFIVIVCLPTVKFLEVTIEIIPLELNVNSEAFKAITPLSGVSLILA